MHREDFYSLWKTTNDIHLKNPLNLFGGDRQDAFIIYTDNDTNASNQKHAMTVLKEYRERTGIQAKLIVIATTATNVTIADPKDPLTFEIVGFDSEAPKLLHKYLTDDLY